MAFALGPKASAAGYRLIAHDSVGSTSTEALAAAERGDRGRLWVVAREQTAGHGRRGRAWQTPKGNLAASLLFPVATGGAMATLGFAAGLALDAAIRAAAPGVTLRVALDEAGEGTDRLQLKWPNDVLVDGAKVAGILLQAVSGAGGPAKAVVVGIGVNVRHAPSDVPYPATSLAACGAEVEPEALFTALADAWVEEVALWEAPDGFAKLRDHWLARAAGLGNPIAVRLGDEVFRGTFETIDNEGRLIVRTPEGTTRSISAGDVHFGAATTARW